MLVDQISKASKARNRLLSPGEDPAFNGVWLKFHHYMAECLLIINQCIRGEWKGKNPNTAMLLGIIYLLFMDLYQKASVWQAHIKGYLAFVEHQGGAEDSLKTIDGRTFLSIILLFVIPRIVACYSGSSVFASIAG